MNLNFKILIFLISVFMVLNFGIGLAQTNTVSTTPPASIPSLQEKEPGAFINQIYNFILVISGILGFSIIVYAGINRILAAGNPSKITEANQRIQDAAIGTFLLFGAYIILKLINPSLVILSLPKLEEIRVESNVSGGSELSELNEGAAMSHSAAEKKLSDAGIGVKKQNTTLEGIKEGTINELIRMKKECDQWMSKYYPNNKNGCNVFVTGGTERGHSSGACSHSNGYKIDIRRTDSQDSKLLDEFITKTYCFKKSDGKCENYGIRQSDKALMFKSPTGATYAQEKDHWDIQITSQCPQK